MDMKNPLPIRTPTPEPPGFAEDSYRLHRRFDRFARLVGDASMTRLFGANVMVVGLGGVGSQAAEALCRSGIGALRLVDFDRICITNSNRQIQAMKGTIGKNKAEVLAERLALINPQADVRPLVRFYEADCSDELFQSPPDLVVDAIDNITAKCHLLATCKALEIPVICSTGASGRMDPTMLEVADLADTKNDPLARDVRRILRQKHAFPKEGPFGIKAVFSTEEVRQPLELTYDNGEGFRCVCPGGTNSHHSCDSRQIIYGTAGFVTGAFGLTLASAAVAELLATPG